MSEDKKKYWDEIDQQLNKVSEERQKEKQTFAENKHRKNKYKKNSKKGRRSKQYAEDRQVMEAISAVEALTSKDSQAAQANRQKKCNSNEASVPVEKAPSQKPEQKKEGKDPMIMLGPEFPLEKFEELAAQKEAAEKSKPRGTIILGQPVEVDQALLQPVEKTVQSSNSPESKKKYSGKQNKNQKNSDRSGKTNNKKSSAVSEHTVQKTSKKKKAESIQQQKPVVAVSFRLDQTMDSIASAIKKTAVSAAGAVGRRNFKKSDETIRDFGSEPFEKVSLRRKQQIQQQYELLSDKTSILSAKFSEKESHIAHKAANVVESADRGIVRISNRAEYLRLLSARKYRELEAWAGKNKKSLIRSGAALIGMAAAMALVIGHMSAYEYMYNGRVLGVVKNQDAVYNTIDIIGNKMSDSYGMDIKIDKKNDISFRRVIGLNQKLDSTDDILNSLSYMRTIKAKGYGIFVDGKRQVVVQNRQVALDIMDTIKELYTPQSDSVVYDKVGFAEKVRIKEVETSLEKIENQIDATNFMLTGAVEKTIHKVESGQTFSGIAKSYGIRQSQLQEMNPGVNPEKLRIGQELYLSKDSPVLTVRTEETVTYSQPLQYEIVYEDTTTLYKGEKTVKLQGVNGEQKVVAKIIKENGVEVENKTLSSEVISQPVNQVVLVGTKATPKLVAGNYKYPVRGARLTSKFGSRWGRTHTGIDLACPTGTRIGASDGGTVTFAGYKGSYGYLVIISHGGGRETYYAHCSKLLVSKGQKVYQGQHIANVGNTGRSTGPHVHFEVRINGTPKNPLNYL